MIFLHKIRRNLGFKRAIVNKPISQAPPTSLQQLLSWVISSTPPFIANILYTSIILLTLIVYVLLISKIIGLVLLLRFLLFLRSYLDLSSDIIFLTFDSKKYEAQIQ
jgi:hypothetical protein